MISISLGCCALRRMESRDQSRMLEELEQLSNSINGLSTAAATRDRTRPDAVPTLTTPLSSVNRTPMMRRLTPSERFLEGVKLSAKDSLQDRTRDRVAELRVQADRLQVGKDSKSGNDANSKSSNSSSKKERDTLRSESSSALPTTSARKNVTTRRSRSRQDSKSLGDSISKELLGRRPRRRSRDRRYSVESGEEIARQLATSTNVTDDQQFVTGDQQLAPSQPKYFLQRNIPRSENAPKVHAKLTELCRRRQTFEEELRQAISDENDQYRKELVQIISRINGSMYEIYERYVDVSSDEDSSVPGPLSHRSPTGFVDVDSLSLPSASQPPFSTPHHPPGGATSVRSAMGRCPEEQEQYRIWFEHSGLDTYLMVWDSMPVHALFVFGQRWMRVEFNRVVSYEDITLEWLTHPMGSHDHEGHPYTLNDLGLVGEVPLSENDVFSIVISEDEDMAEREATQRRDRSDAAFSQKRQAKHDLPLSQHRDQRQASKQDGTALSYEKIKQNFKCPKFSGQGKDWKLWDKGFMRFLSIWDLEHVLDPDFFEELPLTAAKRRENKMVYYILEDAVQLSPLAASYVRKAPINNGFEAYYTLHDGYVFAGSTSSSLLLNELTNFRFLKDETPTALCLRLEELFQDLRMLPGEAAIEFNDTQMINYLLSALRHEAEWETVGSYITSRQIQGDITFQSACNELRVRCEASRAQSIMDRPITQSKVRAHAAQIVEPALVTTPSTMEEYADKMFALVSTMSMKHNQPDVNKEDGREQGRRKPRPSYPCLASGCKEQTRFPLCGTCYHALISGKHQTLDLINGYGVASYDAQTKLVLYPPKVPENRMPSNVRKVKAAAGSIQ